MMYFKGEIGDVQFPSSALAQMEQENTNSIPTPRIQCGRIYRGTFDNYSSPSVETQSKITPSLQCGRLYNENQYGLLPDVVSTS
jgi:hypothetical protein